MEMNAADGLPFELPTSVIKNITLQFNKTWASELTLEDFETLESLYISEEFDVQSFVEFVPNLKFLTVEVPLKDWSFLEKLPKLEGISFSSSSFEDLTLLATLTKLNSITIQNGNLNSLKGIE